MTKILGISVSDKRQSELVQKLALGIVSGNVGL
jgi:hypothetical protein